MVIKKIFLVAFKEIQNTTFFNNLIEHIKIHYKLEVELKNYNDIIVEYGKSTITLLYLSDDDIKLFIKNHLSSGMNIGILPNENNQKIQASYGISDDIYEALDDSLKSNSLSKIDILLCNGQPAFTNIVIGDVHELNNSSIEQFSFIHKVKSTFENLKNLEFKEFTLTTAKDQVIKTAATGIMVFEHNSKHGHYNMINEDLSLHDGQLNAFILSPTSILSYIYYLFMVFFYNKFLLNTLPKSLGIIKTAKLNIESSKPIDYKLDGIIASAKSIELEIIQSTLSVSLGRNIKDIPATDQTAEIKETIKVHNLPKDEMKNMLLSKKIPFFKKAGENDFKELFLSLRSSAELSSVFITLMVLSSLLATTGLFQSSAPVIIGAMILAPLMSPIVSLAMGVVRSESILIKTSFRTLLYGIGTALVFSCIYTYFIPLSVVTDEIRARLNPNILDLAVAVISGIAGAYASAKSEVAKSLAGVAIAVALVPPLSVTGIGIGWGDIDIIYGSFLLFITNLVGITLSAALTFIVLGYAPVQKAKKGIIYTSVILTIVAIPLVISFFKLIDQNRILNNIGNTYFVNEKKINVLILDVDLNPHIPILSIEAISSDQLDKLELQSLKSDIEKSINRKVGLRITTKTVLD